MSLKLDEWMKAADGGGVKDFDTSENKALYSSATETSSFTSIDSNSLEGSISNATGSHVVDLLPLNKSGELGWCRWMSNVFENYTISSIVPSCRSLSISLERAVTVKFREREVIFKSLTSTIFFGLFIGFLAYGTGDFGIYCVSLSGMPYASSFNMVAILFLLISVLFSMQILNIHIVCKKLEIFRFEQRKRCVSMFEFWLATLVTETCTGLVYGLVYSNIVYFLVRLAAGWGKYVFFMELLSMTVMMAVSMAVAFAAVFRVEFLIRDIYLAWFFLMVMMSGYPIHIPYFFEWVQRLSVLNPLKWAYEGSFVWKFENYVDGSTFMTTYGFNQFDKNTIFEVLPHYITLFITIFFIALSPRLNFLTRKSGKHERRRMSTHSTENIVVIAPKHINYDNGDVRNNPMLVQGTQASVDSHHGMGDESSGRDDHNMPHRAVKYFRSPSSRGRIHVLPTVFHKNTSISSKREGTENAPRSSGTSEEIETARGPTVTFDNLFYVIKSEGRVKEALSTSWSRLLSIWRGNSGARYKAGGESLKHGSFGNGSSREVLPTIEYEDEDIVDLGIFTAMGGSTTAATNINPSRNSKFEDPLISSKMTETEARNRDQSKRYVLRNASGKCEWGKLTFIMGHDDSGKSTLLHLLAGMHVPSSTVATAGSIAYDGIPIVGFNEPRRVDGLRKDTNVNSDSNAARSIVDAEVPFGSSVTPVSATKSGDSDEDTALLADNRKRTYRPGYVCGVDEHLDFLTVGKCNFGVNIEPLFYDDLLLN
jgi:ABC-type multidrug transport system fused ATPase/permease subunit